jgi:hypothetical protein
VTTENSTGKAGKDFLRFVVQSFEVFAAQSGTNSIWMRKTYIFGLEKLGYTKKCISGLLSRNLLSVHHNINDLCEQGVACTRFQRSLIEDSNFLKHGTLLQRLVRDFVCIEQCRRVRKKSLSHGEKKKEADPTKSSPKIGKIVKMNFGFNLNAGFDDGTRKK